MALARQKATNSDGGLLRLHVEVRASGLRAEGAITSPL
jgi:hypothetical protein